MQKPNFSLHILTVAALGTALFAAKTAPFDFNIPDKIHTDQENHVLAINCPPGVIAYVDETCEVEITVEIPISTCTITSISYTVAGGPVIVVPLGTIGPISIGSFPPDTFNVVWTVTDNCIPPTNAVCNQPILIQDTISPLITCPDDISVGNRTDGRRNNLLSIAQPDVSDNCGILSVINDFNNTDDASGVYPLGTTVVNWVVTDLYGNTASCDMNVVVFDNTEPIISCPDTLRTTCLSDDPFEFYTEFLAAGGSATDETEIDTSTFTWLQDIDTTFTCPDTIERVYSIGDTYGNFDTCSQIIIVYDTIAPTVICKDVTVHLDENGQVIITADSLDNGSFDNCGGSLVFSSTFALFFGCNDVIQESSQVDVILRATDQCGNSATCISTITVLDQLPPTIICPASITVNNSLNQCNATNVVLGNPSTTDNCNVAVINATFMGSIVTPSTVFPVGSNNVIWTVTDIGGNTATCTQTVVVRDNQSPIISCPSNITVNTSAGLCSAIVNYQSPIGSDNCPSAITNQTVGIISGGIFPIGVTTNTFVVTDNSGASASCSFTVTVVDSQPPTITCPSNITVNTASGLCNAIVNYNTPVGIDNCSGAVTTQIAGLASGSTFPVGITTNTFVVTSSNGQTASCSFTINVIDNQPPSISCPANITVNTDFNKCSAVVNYLTPVGMDNCSNITTIRTSGLASGSTFPSGITTNTFVVTDNNGRTSSCSFNVTVVDNQVPSIICPGNITVALNNSCQLVVPNLSTSVTSSDNCPSTTVTQSPIAGTIIPSSHNQTQAITFTVTDGVGLTATCNTIITSIDNVGPDIVCEGFRVISISDLPELTASSFVISANDNCGGPLTYTARRMGNTCGTNTPDDFGNYVNFCCNDVNDTITIVVRVTDRRGNFTECMNLVEVRDRLAPNIILGSLPDVSVSCGYNINVNNLSAFGTFVPQGSTRQNILINDPGNPFYPTGIAGQDGVFTDNCPGAVVTVTTRNLLTMCNTGEIKRDFVITDIGGNKATYTQTIYVIDVDKFDVNDITWPSANINYNNCNDNDPDVSITGKPILNTDRCNLAAATYKDQVFTNPNNCGFIKRTWTVIDWCQYQTNNPAGIGKWTFVQSILITNNVAPVINSKVCRDTIICTGNGCDATVTFNGIGTDDCLPVSITWSYKIDLDNNGTTDISGVGSSITRKYSIGLHKITWEAKDKCGNKSTCASVFTIKDCKSPNAVALNGLATNLLPPSGQASINAKDFNKSSSDNCTPTSQLKYSFSANVNDKVRNFNCDSLGKRRIEFWVTDLAGNQSRAITYIIVQDNGNICGSGSRVNIKGQVYTEEKVNISDTKVNIDGGETEDYLMTNIDGQFGFTDLAMYNNYELQPIKDTDHGEGITTLDLVLIQRHILGIKQLESPYKLIAADVNNSQKITAADLVELRKLILGIQPTLSNNTSWRFVDASFTFNDKENPWPFVERLNYEGLSTSMENSDFIAIKIGDVNGTVSQNIQGKPALRSNDKLQLYTEDIDVKANELITVPVKVENLDNIIGMQWTLELSADMDYIGFESVDLPLRNEHLAIIDKNGKKYLTLSYDDMDGVSLPKGSVLFNIICRPFTNTKLSDLISMNEAIVSAEAYTMDEITTDIDFSFRSLITEGVSFIMQNHPNPFKDETTVHFNLQEKSPVVINIYDSNGTIVFKSNDIYNPGNHSMRLNANQLGNKYGIFICKIKSKNLDQIIKILRIE